MEHKRRMSTFAASAADAGLRLDVALTLRLTDLSRARAQHLIAEGQVTVSGRPVKASYRLRPGDEVVALISPPRMPRAEPEIIPLPILFEDCDLIVVNKPKGMATHPAAGTPSGTLVNALLGQGRALAPSEDLLRPGIVHRLDKDTSGLLVVARSEQAHRSLSYQIQRRTARRTYLVLVHGTPVGDRGTVCAPVGRHPVHRKQMAVIPGGRHAVTHWSVRERFLRLTFLEVILETGRTHQIRVHMRHIGHPVAGDPLYGASHENLPAPLTSQALHAWKLTFRHPRSGVALTFEAPLPAEFEDLLAALRLEASR